MTKIAEDVNTFFKSVTSRTVGSTSVISLNLTSTGRARFKEITTLVASSDSQVLYLFLGTNQMMSISCTETIDQDVMQFQSDSAETAENTAIALNSVIKGNALSATYEDLDQVITSTATAGENAAMFAAIACLVVLAGLVVFFIVRYKKLGIVASLVSLVFALVIVYALYLLEIQVTLIGILTAIVGLCLFAASNIIVFEEVRKNTLSGKTIQASIKTGYKSTIMTVLDIHIVLFVVGILLAFVGVGEVSACGLILLISTIASYVLYWFTRFMWYVISSPVKDKFKFCGYKRVVYDD
jgi:SecD/SecF fusion protein